MVSTYFSGGKQRPYCWDRLAAFLASGARRPKAGGVRMDARRVETRFTTAIPQGTPLNAGIRRQRHPDSRAKGPTKRALMVTLFGFDIDLTHRSEIDPTTWQLCNEPSLNEHCGNVLK